MSDYEKLGVFYLGREYDLANAKRRETPILYDSKDLTTHGVIIGMTGSGKTGLGLALLEEALIDNIPVIAIDPKGDLGNLLLTFPELRPEDFRPWINEQDAVTAGQTPDQYAAGQAQLWKKGLADWDQSGERIEKLRRSVSFDIFTPGSNAGRRISVLRSFEPPPEQIRGEADLWRDAIQSTATGLLSLLGIEADPLTSRDHILVSNILENAWSQGKSIDLAGLIQAIQAPPFTRVGVLDLESFYPAKDRFALAMTLNNLLASAGFEAWLEGEPLDIQKLLYGEKGKPRASVIHIAHLADRERMFFLTLLLNRLLGWMRTQSGTTSLRAILYIDEVFGYFPPVANPPSKAPLLTLLKQARAFGLGVVLATQNPVDLDYKGLSNAGTWFLGRLQTARDKERVLEGLEGAAAGGSFDRAKMEQTLAGVGKRVFLLHNVHEREPVLFETRWAMSYLRGPMTREEIRRLSADTSESATAAAVPAAPATTADDGRWSASQPVLPPGIDAWFVPASGAGGKLVYLPAVLGATEVQYINARAGVDERRELVLTVPLEEDVVSLDWGAAEESKLAVDDLRREAMPDASFGPLPGLSTKQMAEWEKDLARWIRQERPLTLLRSRTFRETSEPGEDESAFRARLAQKAREQRDLEAGKIRRKYESKFRTLQDRLMRAQQAIERESDQARQKKIDTALSFGSALLGSFLGRKRISAGSASRVSTAFGKASRIGKEQADVERAKQTAASIQQDLAEMERQVDEEIAKLDETYDPASEELEEVAVRASSRDITVRKVGLVWQPFREGSDGRLRPDWE